VRRMPLSAGIAREEIIQFLTKSQQKAEAV
jgi:hypothetical protein